MLEQADKERCQTDVKTNNAFQLGGAINRWERCRKKPVAIATENNPGEDGQIGSMSMCLQCRDVFLQRMGKDYATLTPIES